MCLQLRKKGYEVLYVSEPIDEMTLQNIERVGEKEIADAGKEAAQDLTAEEKEEKERLSGESEELRAWLKEQADFTPPAPGEILVPLAPTVIV